MSISTRRLLDDCFLHDKDRLKHDEALDLLKSRLSPVVGTFDRPLEDTQGFVLAEDIEAARNIPAFDNAAVDGYAMAHDALDQTGDTWLEIGLRVSAGAGVAQTLDKGCAARIFTGAVMPQGADCVVMQEDVETKRGGVVIPAGVKAGINVRKAGEDQRAGEMVLPAGTRLRPFEIAALASTGRDKVLCYQPLKIALISTGDEIIRPGTPFRDGQVYDANHYLLRSLLGTTTATVSDLGIIPDDAGEVASILLEAARQYHLIISTGGASRGEEDHIVATLNERGKLHSWQLAVKPGRPIAFGQLGDAVFLGLPGNPVAVAVCFLLYGLPVCAVLGGAPWREPNRFKVTAGFDMKKKPLRREFLRGWLESGEDGTMVAHKYPRAGSGLISSLVAASGLIELEEDVTRVVVGDDISFIPFGEFGLPGLQ